MPHDALTLDCAAACSTASAPADDAHERAPLTLMDLPIGARARVRGVRTGASGESRELVQRLLEIGFVEGEPVRVVAHGHPGREPVAVRIGGTTFALRRFEAERVLIDVSLRTSP